MGSFCAGVRTLREEWGGSMTTGRRRLLFLASRFPYPPQSGGKIFLLEVAKSLADHHLTLLSMCNSQDELECEPGDGVFAEIHRVYFPRWRSNLNVLSSIFGSAPLQIAYYRSTEFRRKLKALLPGHDAVFAHLIRTGHYVGNSGEKIPRVLLMADAISLAYERMTKLKGTSPLWHLLYRAELRRLHRYEQHCPAEFNQTWLHSDIDREFLRLDAARTRIVPVGINLNEFPFRSGRAGKTVVFVGNMSFSLNLDACRHFIRSILPSLRAREEIKFRIVGACPASIKKDLEQYPAVEVTGAVPRIADAMDDVFSGVCPIRAGAGIQNKILNYLALGIPCVTSEVGLEGLSAKENRDLLVYRTPEEAGQLIAKLYRSPELRENLALNGRRFIEANHDWRAIHSSMRQYVSELFQKWQLS